MPTRGRGRPPRAEVYQRFAMALDDMQKRFGGLPRRHEAETLWRDIWREDAHNSTAIEGNTLVQHEVDQLLELGLTGGRIKALSEYLVVKGYADAAAWVYYTGIDPNGDWSSGDLLTLTEVRYVHQLTMELAWQVSPHEDAGEGEGAGSYRRHEIQTFASGWTPRLRR